MNCPYCNAINDADADFCMGCGQSIIGSPSPNADLGAQQRSQVEYQDTSARTKQEGLSSSSPPAPNLAGDIRGTGELLVMRASNEPEGDVLPGYRRPIQILDEDSVHLARTDRRLEPNQLIEKVRHILEKQDVPVDVHLVNARWLMDPREKRPRLVAFLRNHPYSDLKMIMGVDYMGNWASIQLQIGIEPDPIPIEPPLPTWKMPKDALVALIAGGGLLLLSLILASTNPGMEIRGLGLLGVLGLAYGAVRGYKSYRYHLAMLLIEKGKREAEKRYREWKKAEERMSRTFKVDDMKLFCTAMKRVFNVVVDDIVALGAEKVRVEGGRHGFFQAEEAQPSRRFDAAEAEV